MDSSENLYKDHKYDNDKQFLYILTKRLLTASNKYTLNIEFSSKLRDNNLGLYYGYETEAESRK